MRARSSVVYRSIPTSNRNVELWWCNDSKLYIVLFLHQTATLSYVFAVFFSCISFYSYIKPQQIFLIGIVYPVVYRSIPTSNRNSSTKDSTDDWVVYRSIPTSNRNHMVKIILNESVVYRSIPTSNRNVERIHPSLGWLYIVLFLHQTATFMGLLVFGCRCISFYSYIKPQLITVRTYSVSVVYRSIPTSNRNLKNQFWVANLVVYRSIPTSNRNSFQNWYRKGYVVYRSIPTSNRNSLWALWEKLRLYIVLFLHQTATPLPLPNTLPCCISFYSYIKPQLFFLQYFRFICCISFYSYIKPQHTNCIWQITTVVYRSMRIDKRGIVVYRSIPTSNRNLLAMRLFKSTLYIVLFLHQTATAMTFL